MLPMASQRRRPKRLASSAASAGWHAATGS